MRKLFMLLLAVFVVAVSAVALLGAAIHLGDLPTYEPGKVEMRVEVTPERVARGYKVATMLCIECHLDTKTGGVTGTFLTDLPREFGEVTSANITQHREKGVGAWSDGELAYALRTGVARDGRYLPPYMPKFPNLSDEDMASVIAWLRSDRDEVQARDVAPAKSKPSFLVKALSRGPFKPLPYPEKPIAMPDAGDAVATGRYLTNNLCFHCHSADFKTNLDLNPEGSPGYLAGGIEMLDGGGKPIRVPNITPDDETGIGKWSREEFARALRTHVTPEGRVLRYPMPNHDRLADGEIDGIYAYLRSVAPVKNAVPRDPPPQSAPLADGKAIFAKYGCVR